MQCTYCGNVLSKEKIKYGNSLFCNNRCYINYSQYGAMSWQHKSNTSFLYLMQCAEYYKIGVAADPLTRLRELQTGNPLQITLVHSIACLNYDKIETYLHILYKQYRVRLEWFKLPNDAVAYITSLTTEICHSLTM